MTIYEIPLPKSDGTPFLIRPTLTGAEHVIEFIFNQRLGSWTLNFYDAGRSPYWLGVRGVADWSLLSRCSDPRKPPGRLYLVDTSNRGLDPGENDIGDRVRLVYDDLNLENV